MDKRGGTAVAIAFLVVLGLAGSEGTAIAQDEVSASSDSTTTGPSRARSESPLGVGAHLGWPIGVGLQLHRPSRSYDLLVAWQLDEFVLVHSHARLYERPFPGDRRARYYLGPGLVIDARDGALRPGLSAQAGLNYWIGPADFFVQVTPWIELFPTTRVRVIVGLGGYVHF